MKFEDALSASFGENRNLIRCLEMGVWDAELSILVVKFLKQHYHNIHYTVFGPVAPAMGDHDIANKILKLTGSTDRRTMVQTCFTTIDHDMTKPRVADAPGRILHNIYKQLPQQDIIVVRGASNQRERLEWWMLLKELVHAKTTILLSTAGNTKFEDGLRESGRYSMSKLFVANIAALDNESFWVVRRLVDTDE